MFSRYTIVEAMELLENKYKTEIETFMLKHGLDRLFDGKVSKQSTVNKIAKHLIANPQKEGFNWPTLCEDLVADIVENERFDEDDEVFYKSKDMFNYLNRDGYTFEDGKLVRMFPETIEIVEKRDQLHNFLDKYSFVTAKGHLDQALNNFGSGHQQIAN